LLLNLPRGHAIAAMIQLGRPLHQVTRLTRHPVESFATVDSSMATCSQAEDVLEPAESFISLDLRSRSH